MVLAMSLQETLYRLVLRAFRRISPVFARGKSKLAEGLRGRRTASDELVAWGRDQRDPLRPTVWFHAPSVGEGFQARAVAEALREARPEVQVVYTYFSPSAIDFARGMPADFRGFLPWDVRGEIRPVLDAVVPHAVIFTKTEVWPVLTREADERGIPTLLVGATLPEDAGRASGPGRWLLGATFRRLRAVAAIADEDAERFSLLGIPRERVWVTGDPGIDSAASRLEGAREGASYLVPFRDWEGAHTLVAGSTWPADEAVLLPALSRARNRVPDLRAVIAPHEPGDAHVSSLVGRLAADGWRVALLGEVEERGTVEDVDAVVVDRVGVLAHLYTVGTVAYVGGGFHDQGLHSVLEPAAAGIPVLFGPAHGNARAANDLLRARAAREVASAEELARALSGWREDAGGAREAGERARGYIDGHRGAADRTAQVLEKVLEEGRARNGFADDSGEGARGDAARERGGPS